MPTIGSLSVNIVALTDKFNKGIAAARRSLSGFAGSATGMLGSLASSLSAGALLGSFEAVGSEINDLSIRTGVTAENLSALKYAADQSGSSISALTAAFTFMQKHGIDPDAFPQVAAQLRAIEDPTLRAQAALQLLGKRGAELLPMINDLPQLTAEFEKLGGKVTTDMAQKADALGDSWGKLKVAFAGVRNHIAVELAPEITRLTEYVANNSRGVADWISNHATLVKWIGIAAIALGPLTAGAWAFNTAIIAITSSLTALKAVASAGIIAKVIAAIAASSFGIPLLAGAGALAAGYGINKYMENRETGSGSWEIDNPKKGDALLKETQRTNKLLEQQNGKPAVMLNVAGVR